MSNIGICGAHRTGKTTLAIALSKTLNMPFIEIGTSAIFTERGLDPAKPMDFRSRLWVQQTILRRACNIWEETNETFICDRTSIDMMAYTLAEVGGDTLDKELEWELQDYLRDCREVTEKYFGYLVLVPPAIPIVEAAGKASLSKGYIEHIHSLCAGLWCDHYELISGAKIPRDCLELGDRVKFVEEFWSE
jgi:chloramphenicol 3-O-phosphotransferase